MSSDKRILILIFAGLVIIFAVLGSKWFYENFEYKEVEEITNYSAKARQNKFLAAEYFLRELGFDVESDNNRARLLKTHDTYKTILINNYGPKLSPSHFKELINWLENGGHLIFTANNFQYVKNEDDEEFDYFDEDLYADYKNNQLLEEYGIQAQYTNFSDNNPYPYDITHQTYKLNNGEEIYIDFSPDMQLIDVNNNASFSLKDAYGYHLLQFKVGKGKLTVLSDNYFLSNPSIGEHDHAFLLWLLNSEQDSSENKILLLYNTESDSIFTLIWRYAKHACIAFIVLLFLCLWSMQNRIGPILTIKNYSKRNIIEHLRAIARFSWRQDHGEQLLNQSRIACENALLRRYPALKTMSTEERVQHMAKVLDITPEEIHQALYFQSKSTNEFINSSHHLQKLWILQ